MFFPIESGRSSAAVSRRLHSAVTASARMKQRASEGLGAIWAEIEAAEEEDTLAEMGEGGGAGRNDESKFLKNAILIRF